MNRFRRELLAVVLVLLAISCSPRAQETPQPVTRVLFIGNSYTYWNNVPAMFAKLAEAAHQGTVEVSMMAAGGWALRDHWEKPQTLQALQRGKWDYVVLQEQSTLGIPYYYQGRPRIAGDQVFRPYAEKWVAEVRRVGATPVLFLTWARKATPEDQAALNYAYVHTARELGAVVAPVGVAWGEVRRQQPALELFENDGSHASAAGAYLAACTIYATIFHQSPAGLPGSISGSPINLVTGKPEPEKAGKLVNLPPEQARVLQNAAWQARQLLDRNGGYLDVSPLPPPGLPALPPGTELSPAKLEGTWTGTILFYPTGPAEMTLRIENAGKAHLELKYHSQMLADESADVTDFRLGKYEITFTHPKSVGASNLPVRFRAVSAQPDSLSGTAEAGLEGAGGQVRYLGTWELRKTAGPA
jgi:hypothetical protein